VVEENADYQDQYAADEEMDVQDNEELFTFQSQLLCSQDSAVS
jgi:hypothetical protein